MNNPDSVARPESIAIIGMSGRFPRAKNLDSFWQNLRDGVECISFFSADELASAGVDPNALRDPNFVNAGGVLEDIDLFDASFFGFSARDAEVMDPQQRIFLECAWESLENAGYNSYTYPGLIGVFAGAALSTYVFDLYGNAEALAMLDHFQIGVGNDKDHLTTQVSYKLNLRGPSMAVQTACSTSLVAVCMACQSLLSYQCDIALAGAVAADISTSQGYHFQRGGILSPDGHCRPFDAAAQGTVPGNGIGIVVLKRLSEAVEDRDHIHAVIRGFAVNNDGALKVGYTAPSVDGQAQVIAQAQAVAGIEPDTISYVEAHGTGTYLGDPIEIAALNQVFSGRTKKKGFCAIGSVKSNVGHLDPAAGVAGLIKTVLALKHKLIPPSLHFKQANTEIDFANSPFYVNTKLSEWDSCGVPRRASVSSFGIGGTNAHVIIEEAPVNEPAPHSRPYCLLVLSASTNSALDASTDNLANYLAGNTTAYLPDVAYTLQVGRKTLKHRRMLVCHHTDLEDARNALESRHPQRIFTAVCDGRERPVVFMFPGQGTQHVDMGVELYKVEPTFREQVNHCCDLLRPHLGADLRELIYPSPERRESAARMLRQTAWTQPALFTVEYALAKLWMEWGISPWAMIGHSIGEYVAACLAGVFSLHDAITLMATRGELIERMPEGAMLAVFLSEADIQPLLKRGLSLAAVNGPSLCVVSGPTEKVEQLAVQLTKDGIACQRLHTSHAFHSGMMDPICQPLVSKLRTMRLKAPRIPFLSNVTGTWMTAETAVSPEYWARHLRQTVRFADGLQQLLKRPECVLLEVGPGQTLSALAKQQVSHSAERIVLSTLGTTGDSASPASSVLNTLGKLWLSGVQVNWNGFCTHEQRQRLPLPTYPFEHQPYRIQLWGHDPQVDHTYVPSATRDVAEWFYYPTWRPDMPLELTRGEPKEKSRWLIFDDQNGLGSELIQRLREQGGEVTTVVVGKRFARLATGSYTIRPQERADYEALLDDLNEQSNLPEAIVHLWTVTPADEERTDSAVVERWQQLGFYSLVILVQALEKHLTADSIQISVVSSQIQSVIGTEALCPAKATVLGPCAVIRQEYTNLRCHAIDVDFSGRSQPDHERLVGSLLAELTVEPPDSVVAYRQGRRWIQAFEPVRFTEAAGNSPRLRRGGVYLITGGLGKIALSLAESMARTAQARLVLTGRSSFPDRSQWKELARTAEADIKSKVRKLLEIEELGGEVMVFNADSADKDQMQSVIREVDARFGTIHGVIHAAADTVTYSFVGQTDQTAAERHFRPKVSGLLVLEDLLSGRELDFIVLFSSLTSILGGVGKVAYCAANKFLDVFAGQQNQRGLVPWICVNSDAWHFPSEGDEEEPFAETEYILPEEGVEALRRVLERAPRQIVVSPTDVQAAFAQWMKPKPEQVTAQSDQVSSLAQHPRPNLNNPYMAATTAVEHRLAEIWQQLLGVAPIGTSDNFFDLGGHSLAAIQLISRLRQSFQIEFPVQKIFEVPTIGELAQSIETRRTAMEKELEATTAQVLELVEKLSDSELRALLAENTAPLPSEGTLK
jgi:acyl transferase domain-containing protein/acyl carrier protein